MREPITLVQGEGSTFGPQFDMEVLRREDGVFPTAIIVGTRDIGGVFRPRQILLPHQLYVAKFEEMVKAGAHEVWVLPVFGTFAEVWTQVKLPDELPETTVTGREDES